MENQRTLLYITFFFFIFLLWQAWEQDYGPKPVPVSTETAETMVDEAIDHSIDTPEAVAPADNTLPIAERAPAERKVIKVITDVLELEIDTRGGDIRNLDLRKYPKKSDEPDVPVKLFTDKESKFHIAQSGLISSSSVAPNHHAVFHAEQSEYKLAEGEDEIKVVLTWQQEGVQVNKIYTFKLAEMYPILCAVHPLSSP